MASFFHHLTDSCVPVCAVVVVVVVAVVVVFVSFTPSENFSETPTGINLEKKYLSLQIVGGGRSLDMFVKVKHF